METPNQLSLLGNIRRKPINYRDNLGEIIQADMEAEARKGKIKPKTPEQKPSRIIAPSNYFHLTKEMYDEALGKIKADYGNNPILLKVQWDEEAEIAKGSNPYYAALINTIFREQGIRTATQADLENILTNKILDLNGTYEDSGIVLRSLTKPNEYLAKQIGEQIAKLQGKKTGKLELPIYTSTCYLELTNDPNSPSKLGLKILDDAELIYAPILNSPNQNKFSSSDIDVATGLPKKVGNGDRTLWTRSDGLSWLCLLRGLSLVSSLDSLDYSSENGRVICASTPQSAKHAPKK